MEFLRYLTKRVKKGWKVLFNLKLLLVSVHDFKSAVNATNKNQETPIQLAMINKKHSIAGFMTKCETLGKSGMTTNILVNPTALPSLVFLNDFKGIDSALQVRDSFEIMITITY